MRCDIGYVPWSKDNVGKALEEYENGKFTILDLELSARCMHTSRYGGCLYCDSKVGKPHPLELQPKETFDLLHQASDSGTKWLYICGLGEPKDDPKLTELIRLSRSLGINLSMFTNGIDYAKDDVRFLYDNKVHLIVKCDTLDEDRFNQLLGAPGTGIAQKIYGTIDKLLKIGYSRPHRSSAPMLALSIVPTRINLSDIAKVVEYCAENGIFPLVAELECAGRGRRIYRKLRLTHNQLLG